MGRPLEMLDPNDMMDLILQSVEQSDLFRTKWDREFVKIVLQMALEKGDFGHFVEYYGCRLDGVDFETYFKSSIVKLLDEDSYDEIYEEIFGDEDDK